MSRFFVRNGCLAIVAVLFSATAILFSVSIGFAQPVQPESLLDGFDRTPTVETYEDVHFGVGYWAYRVTFADQKTQILRTSYRSNIPPPKGEVGITWDKNGKAWWLLQQAGLDPAHGMEQWLRLVNQPPYTVSTRPISNLYGFDRIPTIGVFPEDNKWTYKVTFPDEDPMFVQSRKITDSPALGRITIGWDADGNPWWYLSVGVTPESGMALKMVNPPNYDTSTGPKPFFVPPD